MGNMSGSNQGPDERSDVPTEGAGASEELVSRAIGVAYHSPLDVAAIVPEWVGPGQVELVSIKTYSPQAEAFQVVFGPERDLKKLKILVVDCDNGSVVELTPGKLDVFFDINEFAV